MVSWAQVPGTVDVSMSGIGAKLGVALRIFVGAMAAAELTSAMATRLRMPRTPVVDALAGWESSSTTLGEWTEDARGELLRCTTASGRRRHASDSNSGREGL